MARTGASDGDVKITISADAKQAVAEMRRLSAATSAVGQQVDATKDKAKAAKKATSELADSLGALHKANNVVGGSFSALTGPLDDLGDLFEKVGVQQAAVMVGAGALAAAFVGVVAGLSSLHGAASAVIRSWDDYIARAGGASAITEAYAENVGHAHDAQMMADRSAAHLALVFGGELAPVIESTSMAASGLYGALEAGVVSISDTTTALGSYADHLEETTGLSTDAIARTSALGAAYLSARDAVSALVGMGEARNEQLRKEIQLAEQAAAAHRFDVVARATEANNLAEILGMPAQAPAAEDAAARAARQKAEAEDAANRRVDANFRGMEAGRLSELLGMPAQTPVAEDASAQRAREQAALEARQRIIEQTRRAEERQRAYVAALAEEEALWDRIGSASAAASMAALESSRSADVATTMGSETVVTDTGASLDPTTGFQAVDPGVESADQAAVDNTKKTAQEWAQHWQGAIDTAAGAFDMFAGIVVDVGSFIINKTEKDTIKAKKKQFALEKAAAITIATINTFKAVTQALGSMPAPASFVLAALAGAAGAVQIGLIAAQQPKFHRGGILPDEVQREGYVARRNETPAVMTAQAMRAMGGEEGLQRMQTGQPPSAAPIYLVVDGEPRRSRPFAGPDPGFGIRPGWGR